MSRSRTPRPGRVARRGAEEERPPGAAPPRAGAWRALRIAAHTMRLRAHVPRLARRSCPPARPPVMSPAYQRPPGAAPPRAGALRIAAHHVATACSRVRACSVCERMQCLRAHTVSVGRERAHGRACDLTPRPAAAGRSLVPRPCPPVNPPARPPAMSPARVPGPCRRPGGGRGRALWHRAGTGAGACSQSMLSSSSL